MIKFVLLLCINGTCLVKFMWVNNNILFFNDILGLFIVLYTIQGQFLPIALSVFFFPSHSPRRNTKSPPAQKNTKTCTYQSSLTGKDFFFLYFCCKLMYKIKLNRVIVDLKKKRRIFKVAKFTHTHLNHGVKLN